jgi:hypothetical protein
MLALKLVLVPALVAIVTLGVRRWGPAVGGWLSALPVVAGPVLVFYALEQGNAFAARAAQSTVAGLIGTALFALAYGRCATRLAWYVCVPIGWMAFAATIAIVAVAQPSLAVSFFTLVIAAVLARRALPGPDPHLALPAAAVPPGDLPIRMIATATLVVALTAMAAWLGPTWSGLLSAFPVLTTIIAAFTHAQQGSAGVVMFLNGYLRAVIGFGLFCVVLSLSVTPAGLPLALLLALTGQLALHGLMLWGLTGIRERPPQSIQL